MNFFLDENFPRPALTLLQRCEHQATHALDGFHFQISVPVQPGNSGGALVDERGNVVGVVSAKLNARAALLSSGSLPENVNYAVKSSFLLSFLESVPEVSAKLKEPNTKERKFDDVVSDAEKGAVLLVVY